MQIRKSFDQASYTLPNLDLFKDLIIEEVQQTLYAEEFVDPQAVDDFLDGLKNLDHVDHYVDADKSFVETIFEDFEIGSHVDSIDRVTIREICNDIADAQKALFSQHIKTMDLGTTEEDINTSIDSLQDGFLAFEEFGAPFDKDVITSTVNAQRVDSLQRSIALSAAITNDAEATATHNHMTSHNDHWIRDLETGSSANDGRYSKPSDNLSAPGLTID